MSVEPEFDSRLRAALEELHARTAADRAAGKSANTLQAHLDKFLVDWCPKINEELDVRLRANRNEAERAHPEAGSGATVDQHRDRAANVIKSARPHEPEIKERISELREATFKAVLDIQKDRDPDLSPFVARGKDIDPPKDGPLFGVDLDPENVSALKEALRPKPSGPDRPKPDGPGKPKPPKREKDDNEPF